MESKSTDELKSELDLFRREWLSEVRSKHSADEPSNGHAAGPSQPTSAANAAAKAATISKVDSKKLISRLLDEDYEYVQTEPFEDQGVRVLLDESHGKGKAAPLVSALDHFEAAVEKEAQGSLGDSLQLYRKAFRMDNHVDKRYREKYFSKSKTHKPTSSTGGIVAATGHTAHQPNATTSGSEIQTTSELISSFATFSIEPVTTPIQGMPAPTCPMADLPGEVLSYIMQEVALTDARDFARLAQVCKRFAYAVATDSSVWRRLCESPVFGFPGMHYKYTRTLIWSRIEEPDVKFDHEKGIVVNKILHRKLREARRRKLTYDLLVRSYGGSWKAMFRSRPRIRFGGAYISTVNYWRPGQSGPNQYTWGSPMHIVTYYRYLRFFRDGTLISLLTTLAPAEVIPHFTRENAHLKAKGGATHLPSSAVAGTFKGRWKLGCSWDCSADSGSDMEKDMAVEAEEAEANIFIETEGVGKYTFEMELAMRSAGRVKRNNKLVWKSFCSYNPLTDDRGEFSLKNDKPFYFSRVASYGIGD